MGIKMMEDMERWMDGEEGREKREGISIRAEDRLMAGDRYIEWVKIYRDSEGI